MKFTLYATLVVRYKIYLWLYHSSQSGFMGTIAGDYNRQHSSGYVHLAELDGWHCRRRFAKVVLSK